MNELDIKKDIVAVVQQRRLGHFGTYLLNGT